MVNASIRTTSWDDLLTTSYGQLIMVKTAATVVLGSIRYMHRQWIIPRLESSKKTLTASRLLWQLILAELTIMGSVSGIAVALSRLAPPQASTDAVDDTAAVSASGYGLPPALTLSRWFADWRIDWLWLAFALSPTAAYLAGVRRLRPRGTRWPVPRTLCWLVGVLALVYNSSGGPAVYGRVLFSAHMVYMMGLTTVVPVSMVLSAPVPLAIGAATPRGDGSRGMRDWILVNIDSRFWQLVTHPLVAAGTLADLFGFAIRNHLGHELLSLYFTRSGIVVRPCHDRLPAGPAPRTVSAPSGAAAGHDGLPRIFRTHLDRLRGPVSRELL